MASSSTLNVVRFHNPGAKTERKHSRRTVALSAAPPRLAVKARRKFLRAFPGGFRDETYLDWERDYKWNAHRRWREVLSESTFRRMIQERQFQQIASLAIGIESRTNLLFSFEKMALRDAVRSPAGAQAFAAENAGGPFFELGGGCVPFAAKANARTNVAVGDRVRLHCSTCDAFLLQADGDARSSPAVRFRSTVCLAAFMASISGFARVRSKRAERHQRPQAARHD
jgi:hypothetical protein